MKKKISLLLAFIFCVGHLFAQDYAASEVESPVIRDIINSYAPWTSVEFNGKIKNDLLPISPTVKMYMENGTLIQVSLRAPILGEIGRLEFTPDNILVVNKMKNTYLWESTANLMEMYPGIINDIQSIFLARVTVFGTGQLSDENSNVVEVQQDGNGNWILIPASEGLGGLKYGYLVGPTGRTQALDAIIKGFFDMEILYTYPKNTMKMDVNFNAKNKNVSVEFDFSSVKWGGSKMGDVKLDKYTRMGLKEFISNL